MPNQNTDQDTEFTLQEDVNFFKMFASKEEPVENGGGADPKKTAGAGAAAASSSTEGSQELSAEQIAEKEKNDNLLKEMLAKGPGADQKAGTDQGTAGGKTNNDAGGDAQPAIIQVLYDDFVEKGIIDAVEGEFDGKEETFVQAIDKTIVSGIQEGIEAEINGVFKDPVKGKLATDFFKHLQQNGDINEFIAFRSHEGLNAANLDSEDAAVKTEEAKKTLKMYYGSLGWDADKIARSVSRSEAKGLDVLVDEAKDVASEVVKMNKQKEQARKEELENKTREERQSIQSFNTETVKLIETVGSVAGFDLKDKKMQEKLKNYMFTPSVDVQGKKVPAFLADRAKAAKEDPTFLLAQALLLMNKMKPDTASAETAVTKSLSEKLKDIQSGKGKSADLKTGAADSKQTGGNESFDFNAEEMEVVVM